jgi:hypothetical protein
MVAKSEAAATAGRGLARGEGDLRQFDLADLLFASKNSSVGDTWRLNGSIGLLVFLTEGSDMLKGCRVSIVESSI